MDQSGPGSPERSAPHSRHATDVTAGVTRNEYDALADLFLGDAAFAPAMHPVPPVHSSAVTPRPTVQVHAHGASATPSLHLTGQPAVHPESRADTTAPNVWRLVGDPVHLDAAALTSAPQQSHHRVAQPLHPRDVTIEAIVQGHLPIFASAWVPQYARSLSQETRSAVALIRVRHGQISVERFAADASPAGQMPKHATLAEAVESAHAPRVLVQVDELSEPDLWRTPGLDRITVLTGADEAAMVACYRTLKTIAQELAHDLSPDHVEDAGAPARPAFAIAVLGATPERAEQAITRMQRAASNFLSRHVHGHHAAGRISAGHSETLFRGVALEGDSSPVALIALIRASADIAAESARATPHLSVPPTITPAPTPAETARPTSSAPRTSAWDRVAARLEEKLGPSSAPAIPHVEPKLLHTVDAGDTSSGVHTSINPAELIDLAPSTPAPTIASPETKPTVADLTAHDTDCTDCSEQPTCSQHPPLASFVDELLAIDEQCPYADAVEFAIAADGRLHVLAHTGNHTHHGHPGGQGRALEELTTAASWAMAHSRIFTRVHPSVKLDDTEHRPVLHLITDRPREARRLLESDIRIHLVAPVDPAARFVCRDLN